MSTTTLHGIPSTNYWQSHHSYLRMYRNLIIIVVAFIIITTFIRASLASQLQCHDHVKWCGKVRETNIKTLSSLGV